MALLELNDLHTFFKTKRGTVKAVNGVSYKVEAGRTLGVVGESGSGKSVSAMSILQLLDGNGYIDSGTIMFNGRDLTKLTRQDMYKIRGNEISVIFQEPMTSLNPVFTVERQVSEPFMIHQGMTKKEAAVKVVEMLKDVKIPNPETVAKQYPHQLSGGMRQRVMIAMALACRPKLLIADEPTTALDVTIQAKILELIKDIQQKMHLSVIYITHDLGVVAKVADYVNVMYAGKIVEVGNVEEIFYEPRHPYTWGLLSAMPDLDTEDDRLYSIPGSPPNLLHEPVGDAFAARNRFALQIDKKAEPPLFKISETHYAATWLLHPDAPAMEMPRELKESLERARKEAAKFQ